MTLSTVGDWLEKMNKVHPQQIALGLERVREVGERLRVLQWDCPVVVVGGTNGKGSTVAGLEHIYTQAGYCVGAFTSPMLFQPNEQIRIGLHTVRDDQLCEAFAMIETARGEITLTPFEFMTLAALVIFKKARLDVLLLEVGLGGRLDAVNIVDADVAIITSISLDHTEWLGSTREAIAYEKSGIMRKGQPVICGDRIPPVTLTESAMALKAPLYGVGEAFDYEETATHWSWRSDFIQYDDLPRSLLLTQNMALVLMAITLLAKKLPVKRSAIEAGLQKASLPGRLQIIEGAITKIYDVSHNPASIALLAHQLQSLSCTGKTRAVFSMLADKDIQQSLPILIPFIDEWYVAPLQTPRSLSKSELKNNFKEMAIEPVYFFETLTNAYRAAESHSTLGDRIIIFGSFHTVAEALATTSLSS